MHGSVVIFCLYEDYEKIEFCVISLDRVCISRASGGGRGLFHVVWRGPWRKVASQSSFKTNMLVLKDQELTYEVLCPRDRIPCTVI